MRRRSKISSKGSNFSEQLSALPSFLPTGQNLECRQKRNRSRISTLVSLRSLNFNSIPPPLLPIVPILLVLLTSQHQLRQSRGLHFGSIHDRLCEVGHAGTSQPVVGQVEDLQVRHTSLAMQGMRKRARLSAAFSHEPASEEEAEILKILTAHDRSIPGEVHLSQLIAVVQKLQSSTELEGKACTMNSQ